jgi:sec-independent protein translocase protein TatA
MPYTGADERSHLFRQIGTGEILLILAVLILLFGARKLPELARALGRSARELRKGMEEDDDEEETSDAPEHDSEEGSAT